MEAHEDSGNTSQKARLLVVDDQAFMRIALKALLERDSALMEVVGEAQDGQEAIECCRKLHPDLILMDVSMPKMNGLEATGKIKAEFPMTSVLIVTAHADHRLLMDAIKAGAAGYVLKGEPSHISEAVRAVLKGETPLDQGLAMTLLRRLSEEAAAQQAAQPPAQPSTAEAEAAAASVVPNPLTPRETEVLARLAMGKTNRQIATELHLSLSTVKRHLEHILSKLKVSDRTQAAVKAFEMGLLAHPS